MMAAAARKDFFGRDHSVWLALHSDNKKPGVEFLPRGFPHMFAAQRVT